MRHRKLTYILILVLIAISLILAGIIWQKQDKTLKVIFLDVGQGDAILISQGSKQILIDGGPSGQALLEKLGRYIPFWDRNIEVMIATHPDADHIGGLISAMQNYKIGTIVDSTAVSDSQVFKKYQETIESKKIDELKGTAGMGIKLAENNKMQILNPESGQAPAGNETNSMSIVAKLIFGQNSFLFTGDLPSEQELKLIKNNIDLQARVLKVGHHGSKYSTSQEFLDKVQPEEAIISVGKNNTYGHPAPEIIERLKNKNIDTFRTDEMGDIAFSCGSAIDKCAMVVN